MKYKYYLFLQLIILTFIISGCSKSPDHEAVSKTEFYFDTVVTITLYGKENEKYIDECMDLCEKYEKLFSRTISDSDISKINTSKGCATAVEPETIELIDKGLKYSTDSDGIFDITIGSVSRLWDFSSGKNIIPPDKEIAESVKNINYNNVVINDNTVILKNPNTVLDLGGIAKGYVADKIKSYLISKGVHSGVIDLGGNILLIGNKPDKSNYNIGIRKPFSDRNQTLAVVRTCDKSIVSSGSYERYFYTSDNVLFHHILDTKTGYPVESDLVSVTIISDNSIDGDALSTTCFALGYSRALKLIEATENVEAVFVDSDNNITLSSGLKMSDGVITVTH